MQNSQIRLNDKDKFLVGVKWENNTQHIIDIDLLALMLDDNKQLKSKDDLIFYNNFTSKTGALFHTGDNTTGNSDNDDETILVNLQKIPKNINYLRFAIVNSDELTNYTGKISYRIAKMDNIFDDVGCDKFNHTFEDNDFHIIYLFEAIRKDEEFIIYIKNKKFTEPLSEVLSRYKIQFE